MDKFRLWWTRTHAPSRSAWLLIIPGDALKKANVCPRTHSFQKETSGLLVPVSAILRNEENLPFVYVVQPEGSFARQRVTLGYRDGNRYDITSGLKAGDRVVADGGLFVQFMQNQ